MQNESAAAQLRQAVLVKQLRACQLFAGAPYADLEAVAAFAITKHFNKGGYLFREGEPAQGFYIVQKGTVSVHRVNAAGKEQVIHVFRPGDSLAEAALLSEGGYPADARALEPATVLLVPKAEFSDLLRRRPELALRMLGSMSQHLRVLVSLLDDLTLKNVEARLANWLLERCPEPDSDEPVTFQLDRTKRVLAAELGITSETLSRTFAAFRRQNLLHVKSQTLTVLHPHKLGRVLRGYLGESDPVKS